MKKILSLMMLILGLNTDALAYTISDYQKACDLKNQKGCKNYAKLKKISTSSFKSSPWIKSAHHKFQHPL